MDDVDIPQYVYKWYLPLWRPEMSRKSRRNVICILESGLLFKEDSLSVEESLCLRIGSHHGLGLHRILPTPCTRTERIAATVSVLVCVMAVPITTPIGSRGNMLRLCCYAGAACIPLALRLLPPASLPSLLTSISQYTMLARRHITSKIWFPVESVSTVLVSQQKYMCRVVRSANMALLGVFPWLEGPRGSTQWEDSHEVRGVIDSDDLTKIHHLLLVLQSTFLKNLALAHFPPTAYTSQYSRSNNDRVYWMHTMLIPAVTYYFENCSMMLENAYKYYKEVTRNRDTKLSLPRFINNNRDPWQYSEVHGSVSAIGTDLRSALVKCNEMDSFLEACWTAKSKFSPELLHDDLTKVRDNLLKCFASVEMTFVQLKKIRSAEMKLLEAAVQKLPLPSVEEEDCDSSTASNIINVSEESPLQIQDQVFYYEKTDDADNTNGDNNKVADYSTGPGKNEIDTTKIVLGELKVKLVKKEDEMREREAKALENTMPELKGKIPQFPRQINLEKKPEDQEVEDDQRICKFYNTNNDTKIKNVHKNNAEAKNDDRVKIDGRGDSVKKDNGSIDGVEKVNIGQSNGKNDHEKSLDLEEQNEDCKEVQNGVAARKTVDFLSDDYYGSSSDVDREQEPSSSLLKDVRKHRVSRKKKHPPSRSGSLKLSEDDKNDLNVLSKSPEATTSKSNNDFADEGLKPVEYSFGTGLAMASLLQIQQNRNANINLPVLGNEEVFDGEGEVSNDSGNEDQ